MIHISKREAEGQMKTLFQINYSGTITLVFATAALRSVITWIGLRSLSLQFDSILCSYLRTLNRKLSVLLTGHFSKLQTLYVHNIQWFRGVQFNHLKGQIVYLTRLWLVLSGYLVRCSHDFAVRYTCGSDRSR